MKRPVRTTIAFALVSGFIAVPITLLLSTYLGWSLAFKLTLWADLGVYAILLARWSRTRLLSVAFPLILLLGTAIWPHSYTGFFFLAAGVLCWVRSGICFQAAPLRTLAGEVITVLGGSSLVMLLGGRTSLSWAIGIFLFTLVQTLYFFIVPGCGEENRINVPDDPFERAMEEARKVLDVWSA